MVEQKIKCGVVAIVGRPNVGKSTLLNYIIKEKISIVTPIPQTTRYQIRGIYNDERGQIIFIDTPGVHMGRDALDKCMHVASIGSLDEADCLIYLVDTIRKVGQEEEYIASALKNVKTPMILGLNKVDISKGKRIPEYVEMWERVKGQSVHEMKDFILLPLSSQLGNNVEKLIDLLFDYLPEGPRLYDAETISDFPQRMAVADIIREKLFLQMREEVPHSIGVVIEDMRPKRHKTLHIKALIFVERDSQKEMVIGRKGETLKKIGILARQELEELLESKVYLELYVKTEKRWRDNVPFLTEAGFQTK